MRRVNQKTRAGLAQTMDNSDNYRLGPTDAARRLLSSPGRSDMDNKENNKLGEEGDKELWVQGLQGCVKRGQNA